MIEIETTRDVNATEVDDSVKRKVDIALDVTPIRTTFSGASIDDVPSSRVSPTWPSGAKRSRYLSGHPITAVFLADDPIVTWLLANARCSMGVTPYQRCRPTTRQDISPLHL